MIRDVIPLFLGQSEFRNREFYETFWSAIGPGLVGVFSIFLAADHFLFLFATVLLPKSGGDPAESRSWHPMSRLTSDYKMFST